MPVVRHGDYRSQVQKTLTRLVGSFIDLVFPLSCAGCGREGGVLCEGCGAGLARLEKPYCSLCANPGAAQVCSWCAETAPPFDGIRAPYLMAGAVKEMVYGLKYRNLRASAPWLGGLMAAHLERDHIPADVLIPVPLHKRRERERGYNQSELLALEVGKRTGIPVNVGALKRVKDTAPQVSVRSHEERRRNIEGAFQCTGEVGGLRVLLIDDVVTTGSTMAACAGPLKDAGAASVWGLSLARQA